MNSKNTREKLAIGNWKMHKNPTEAALALGELRDLLGQCGLNAAQVGLCPTALCLDRCVQEKSQSKPANQVGLFAQNAHWEPQGAFTGEWSARMLKDLGAQGALVAHSERRQFFGESNHAAGKRVGALLSAGLRAVYCIGETLEERQHGNLKTVLSKQLKEALASADLKPEHCRAANGVVPLVLAYEPVWAIGTGLAAEPAHAQEAHFFIRSVLAELLGAEVAQQTPVLYGGSVKPDNIATYMAQPDVDGALVGGASLKPHDFLPICKAVLT